MQLKNKPLQELRHQQKMRKNQSEPRQQEVDMLVTLFNQGRYAEGELLAREMTIRFPRHGFGWKVLGAMLKLQARSAEAVGPMQKAAQLMPQDEQVQNNLGVVFGDLNRLSEAEGCHRRAVRINPVFVEAHFNLGNNLQAQDRLADAAVSYRHALKIKPDFVEAHFNLGNALRRLGATVEAEASYRQTLELKPDHVSAHNNLGVTLAERGLLSAAEVSYRRVVELAPQQAVAHNNLGNTLKDLGRYADAEASYRQALQIRPDFAEGHNNLGNVLKDQGRHVEAEASYRRALELQPNYAEAQNNLGIALKYQDRLVEAELCYRRALEIKPDFAEAFYNLGIALTEQDRLSEAESSYRRTLTIKPDYAEAHNNLGNCLEGQCRFAEAEASHRRALAIKPDYADAHCNLGNSLRGQGRLVDAEESYRCALAIKPTFAEALYNLGIALTEQDRLIEGEACYRQALQIKPDYAEAHRNLGNVLKEHRRFAEAEHCYRRALAIKPTYVEARGNLLFNTNYTATHSPAHCLEEAREYGRALDTRVLDQKATARFSAWECTPQPKRLRVGMVSGDFQNHPVGYFLEALLKHIDRERIELVAYPTHHAQDDLTVRIRPYFSAWKPLFGQGDAAAAQLIHDDGVHVLLDLAGHTAKNRLPVFAWQPAPTQVSWLGYFATTGVAQMDYLLGDPTVTPVAEENHFTETVWRLPDSYLCFTPPDVVLNVGSLPALDSGGITFGCFNNLTKMTDAVVDVWSRVLHAVPGSRLLLKTQKLNDDTICASTRERFASRGIAPDRLLLEGSSPRVELLAAYQRVDIALDPFPYPGGTTSVEGLWMGVPVITRRGDRFISHVGESIAHTAGLSDWIAADDDDYVSKAVAHTTDLQRLATLRAGLRQQVLTSPLFDAQRFARNFEAAMWGMWQAIYAGKAMPSQFPTPAQSTTDQKERDASVDTASSMANLFNQARYAEMEVVAQDLTQHSPHDGVGWKALGTAVVMQGRTAQALEYLQKAALLLPEDADVQGNLGNILKEHDRLPEAAACYARALELRPDFAEAHYNLGNTLKSQGRLPEAETHLRLALKLKPAYAEAHDNLGVILLEQGQVSAAEASHRASLAAKPDLAEAHCNLGIALKAQGRLPEAEASYRKALTIDPQFTAARSNLLFALNYTATHSSSYCLEEAREYGRVLDKRVLDQKTTTRFIAWRCTPQPQRLRVGVVSGDLKNHPVGYFLEGVLKRIDPERIELIAYPTHHAHDDLTARIRPYFSAWKPLFGQSDAAAARLVHDDGVHVLLDLAGHTAKNRLSVFAWQPAPVQVSWLGYFASTGVAQMDYLLGDPTVTPIAEENHFTEKVWRLPDSYLCFTMPDAELQVGPLPALAGNGVTFGCFNNLTKMTDAVVALWSRVLAAIPHSRLFLKATQLNDVAVCESTRQHFAAKGIASERLLLEGSSPRAELLAAYQRVDIALDPFPYPGGTTTVEGLWMGVPVITRRGDRFLSHVGESIAHTAGLSGWIAADDDDYVSKAVAHASNLQRLATLRANLRQQVLASPLFDAQRFARNFEAALSDMWQRQQSQYKNRK